METARGGESDTWLMQRCLGFVLHILRTWDDIPPIFLMEPLSPLHWIRSNVTYPRRASNLWLRIPGCDLINSWITNISIQCIGFVLHILLTWDDIQPMFHMEPLSPLCWMRTSVPYSCRVTDLWLMLPCKKIINILIIGPHYIDFISNFEGSGSFSSQWGHSY